MAVIQAFSDWGAPPSSAAHHSVVSPGRWVSRPAARQSVPQRRSCDQSFVGRCLDPPLIPSDNVTGPPCAFTLSRTLAGTRNTRPGEAGQGNDFRAMTLPSWRTTILGIRTRVSVHSRSRLRAGAMSPGRRMRARSSAGVVRPGIADTVGMVRSVRADMPNGFGNVSAVEGGDVGGVDRVQQVADGEDAGSTGARQRLSTGGLRFLGRHSGEAGSAGEYVIGDPVTGPTRGCRTR